MDGVIVVVGARELAAVVRRLGFYVREVEYFWGALPVDPEWLAAVVDVRAGGGTGLDVAHRFERRLVTPVVTFPRGDRQRVVSRFAGIERPHGLEAPEFCTILKLAMNNTLAARRRSAAGSGDTTEIDVGKSMILGIQPEEPERTLSRRHSSVLRSSAPGSR